MKKILITVLALCLCMGIFSMTYGEGEDQLPDGDLSGISLETQAPTHAIPTAPASTAKPRESTPEPLTPSAAIAEPEGGLEGFSGAHIGDADLSGGLPAIQEDAALVTPNPEDSPAPTATFPPIEVAAVKEQKDMRPVWILVVAMGVVIIILQVILMRMRKK